MLQQSAFQIAFLRFVRKRQKIEVVRVFDELLREIGLWPRKSGLKIRGCFPLPFIESTLYLQRENVSAPSILDRCIGVPKPFLRGLNLLQQS